jgi:hypothetical protein
VSLLATAEPATIAEVLERMESIEGGLPRSDGVACFVHLYLAVTQGVRAELTGTAFASPRFMSRLDVVFADAFFSALEAFGRDPATAPRAWMPLFEDRSHRGILPLQFALAGMNAHINGDLPVALVTTCGELGIELRCDSPEHEDYLRVNAVLARVEARIRSDYLTGPLGLLDRVVHRFHRIGDVVAMWDVSRARDAAWANALALWTLRGRPDLSSRYLLALDRTVGFGGRGLLRLL